MKTFFRYHGIPGYIQGDGERWIANDFGPVSRMVRETAQNICEMDQLGQSHAEDCPRNDPWSECHHRWGRGGGKRNDLPVLPDGTKNLFCLSRKCHEKVKIERRPAKGNYEHSSAANLP